MKLTRAEIEAGISPRGGYTAETLASWGVPWPPPKGWKEMLLAGDDIPEPEPYVPPPVTEEQEKWARLLCRAYGEVNGGNTDPDELIGCPELPRWRAFIRSAMVTIQAMENERNP